MFITLINDCTDENVRGRLGTRISSLFSVTPTFIGVGDNLKSDNSHDPAEYEAAGNLIDVLDAAGSNSGVILVNVANRHGKGKKWPNGTPFGFFYIKNILVISTVDGLVLSLVKKLRLVDDIYLLDIPTVVNKCVKKGIISPILANQITHTQFRSFEFQPLAAKWLINKISLPAKSYSIEQIEDMPRAIWYRDNFGNCKTTLLPKDISFKAGKSIKTKFGLITCFTSLKDVPNNKAALIVGSSGYKDKRFIEFVVQGESAVKKYNLYPGIKIFAK